MAAVEHERIDAQQGEHRVGQAVLGGVQAQRLFQAGAGAGGQQQAVRPAPQAPGQGQEQKLGAAGI